MTRITGGALGFQPSIVPADIEFAWSGNVTATSITVKCRSASSSVTLLWANNSGLVSPTSVAGTEGNDNVFTFPITGLTASTDYWYTFVGWDETERFKTFPTAGSQASFTIAAGSCAGSPPGGANAEYQGPGDTSNTPAWARIEDRLPLLFVNMGDWGYPDITSGVESDYWQNYKDNFANARQASLWRKVPFVHTPSDHDFSDADSDGTYVGKAAFQSAWRNYNAHYPLPTGATGAVYQTLPLGRTDLWLLDTYSEASPRGATDNSSKTMLGATQKQWLKDGLLASTAKAHLICVNWPWNEPGGWGAYSTERAELDQFWLDNGIRGKIALLQADWHFSAFDDGTNTHFAATGSAPGPPIFHFAPLDQNITAASGTYSEGTVFDNQMYGLLEVVDSGATITVTGKAYSCPTTTTETLLLTYTHVFTV